jgi:hypothetical protein
MSTETRSKHRQVAFTVMKFTPTSKSKTPSPFKSDKYETLLPKKSLPRREYAPKPPARFEIFRYDNNDPSALR